MKPFIQSVAVVAALCLVAACSKQDAASAAAPMIATAVAPAAASGQLAATLCAVLRKKVPDLKGMPQVGARAQLVMAIATAFDSDATALATVSSEIDPISSSGCPEVREPLLAATKAASLQEAVR